MTTSVSLAPSSLAIPLHLSRHCHPREADQLSQRLFAPGFGGPSCGGPGCEGPGCGGPDCGGPSFGEADCGGPGCGGPG